MVLEVDSDTFTIDMHAAPSAADIKKLLPDGEGVTIARYRVAPAGGDWNDPEFLLSEADSCCYMACGRFCCERCCPEPAPYVPLTAESGGGCFPATCAPSAACCQDPGARGRILAPPSPRTQILELQWSAGTAA